MSLQGHWRTLEDGSFPSQNQHFYQTAFVVCLKLRSDGKIGLVKTHKSVICFASVHFICKTYGSCSKPYSPVTCININYQETVKNITAASTKLFSCFFSPPISDLNNMSAECGSKVQHNKVMHMCVNLTAYF